MSCIIRYLILRTIWFFLQIFPPLVLEGLSAQHSCWRAMWDSRHWLQPIGCYGGRWWLALWIVEKWSSDQGRLFWFVVNRRGSLGAVSTLSPPLWSACEWHYAQQLKAQEIWLVNVRHCQIFILTTWKVCTFSKILWIYYWDYTHCHTLLSKYINTINWPESLMDSCVFIQVFCSFQGQYAFCWNS